MKKYSQDEIELMSYDDIAYILLTENKKKMQIQPLFKKVCEIQKLDDSIFENHIGDFFELLSTDKRFIMLPKGFWDLKDRHAKKVIIENDDEEELLEESELTEIEDTEDIENEDTEKEDLFKDYDETDDETDNEYSDLVVVDDEEDLDTMN